MSRRILQPRGDICRLCDFLISQQSSLRQSRRIPKAAFNSSRTFTTTKRNLTRTAQIPLHPEGNQPLESSPASTEVPRRQTHSRKHITEAELETELHRTRTACNALFAIRRIPTDQETTLILGLCRSVAEAIAGEPAGPTADRKDGTATSALLSLDESNIGKVQLQKLSKKAQRMVDELSRLAYSIVKHPTVFITPEVLEAYVATQSCLGKAETFGEVFYLYANKPLAKAGSSPIAFKKQNPDKVSNEVPIAVADRALQTAIDAKQLIAGMDIVDTTYATKAFRRAKFIRKALLPCTGLTLAPVAAYTVASQLAAFQTTMETGLATNVAFAGILSYFAFTASIGVVAITTANDQMERVTWAKGMPLRERWIREEERAAIDKIACSWGFREVWRRGEEEGEDWLTLREWIGNKGMILDAVELMEGME